VYKSWLHQNILFGSCWLTDSEQCFPPEVKGIDYYTASDKALGQFLLENCFDLKLRCLNAKCKRDVLRHLLAYTHNESRLLIRVTSSSEEAAPSSVSKPSSGHNQNSTNLSGMSPPEERTPWLSSSGSARSEKSALETSGRRGSVFLDADHKSDDAHCIWMWSFCKICDKNVTPKMPMSESTFQFSFGKFLDLTFYNDSAVCHVGTCGHSVNQEHVRCFGFGDLVARFEYEKVIPYKVVINQRLTYNRRSMGLIRIQDLKEIIGFAHLLFPAFLDLATQLYAQIPAPEARAMLKTLRQSILASCNTFRSLVVAMRALALEPGIESGADNPLSMHSPTHASASLPSTPSNVGSYTPTLTSRSTRNTPAKPTDAPTDFDFALSPDFTMPLSLDRPMRTPSASLGNPIGSELTETSCSQAAQSGVAHLEPENLVFDRFDLKRLKILLAEGFREWNAVVQNISSTFLKKAPVTPATPRSQNKFI
jgi:hypothetical protein